MKFIPFFTSLLAYSTANHALAASGGNTWAIGHIETGEDYAAGNLSTVMDMLRSKTMLLERPARNVSADDLATNTNISTPTSTLSSHISKRSDVTCDSPEYYLNSTDVARLLDDWNSWCSLYPIPKGLYLSGRTQFNSRISACSTGGSQMCDTAEMARAFARVDAKCPGNDDGWPAAGNWYESDWKKMYERNTCDQDMICGGHVHMPCDDPWYEPA
ncbi:hypothetical protein KJ359_001944 [Pestalotiopsis sp. 9143b]|nr:hypothetical protein KJ359_001944 [Pestalotiopsis sp. 9143b]